MDVKKNIQVEFLVKNEFEIHFALNLANTLLFQVSVTSIFVVKV